MTAKRKRKSAALGSKSDKAAKALAAKVAKPKAAANSGAPTIYEIEGAVLGSVAAQLTTHISGPSTLEAAPDIAIPLTSRAVFWQPRNITRSRSLLHVPFLFWLMETIQPTRVVQLGLEDPTCFLALCQAADKLGLEAILMGVHLNPEKPAMSPTMAEQHATLYGDFSFVVSEDFARAARQVRGGQIDLLVIDTLLSDEHVMALRAHWMPLLSERAVVVFHDPDNHVAGPEARQYVDSLLRARPGIRFPQTHPGLDVVLLGGQQPERLTRMAELEQGMPGYLAAWQVFARLGQGLENDQLSRSRLIALNKSTQEVKEQQTRLDRLAADLAKEQRARQAALDSEADQIAQLAGLQAQIFDLQSALETARGNNLQAVEKTARKLEALAAEKADLETALAEARSALEQAKAARAVEVEAVRNDLKLAQKVCADHEADMQILQAQNESVSKVNSRLHEQVKQMLDKRLTLWETHEALKETHAALLEQLKS